jgi:predicted nicotinamide N-methyase
MLKAHLRGRTGLAESTVEVGARTYRIVHPASVDDLLDEEDFEHDERLPYWAELWPSAVALGRSLAREDLAGLRVVELGCGVGLPTVVALDRGAQVLATDHNEAALDFVAHNAREELGRQPGTALLDWFSPELDGLGPFDLVFAADVLYERRNVPALADLVPKLLAPGGKALFADPRRPPAPSFLEAMGTRGFRVSTEGSTVEQGGREVKVLLYRFRPKS